MVLPPCTAAWSLPSHVRSQRFGTHPCAPPTFGLDGVAPTPVGVCPRDPRARVLRLPPSTCSARVLRLPPSTCPACGRLSAGPPSLAVDIGLLRVFFVIPVRPLMAGRWGVISTPCFGAISGRCGPTGTCVGSSSSGGPLPVCGVLQARLGLAHYRAGMWSSVGVGLGFVRTAFAAAAAVAVAVAVAAAALIPVNDDGMSTDL